VSIAFPNNFNSDIPGYGKDPGKTEPKYGILRSVPTIQTRSTKSRSTENITALQPTNRLTPHHRELLFYFKLVLQRLEKHLEQSMQKLSLSVAEHQQE
jgi:hypothetical protein